jgi:tetratricopeptide (TPR) repeat protein
MNYADYVQGTQRAADLVQTGHFDAAMEILQRLLNSDISDIDKSIMCLNIAVVYDKLDQNDKALEWHDQGIVFERPYARAFVALHKAGYLATQGRVQESLQLYQELAALPFLTESDKETIRQNIATLEAA